MLLSRLNRYVCIKWINPMYLLIRMFVNSTLSKGLILNGVCGWRSAKQRLSLPTRRLFAENGKKCGRNVSSGIRRCRHRSTLC